MVKRFLVTTALEETWGKDKSILFLGEWCAANPDHAERGAIDDPIRAFGCFCGILLWVSIVQEAPSALSEVTRSSALV